MGKMQVYIERLMQSKLEVTEDASRKRGLAVEPTDGLDNAKRARLDAMTPPVLNIPPLPPGPISYDQLFTLTQDIDLCSFDVKLLPPDLLVNITVPLLAQVNQSMLTQAVDVSGSRENLERTKANMSLGCTKSI
jgi:symplekin